MARIALAVLVALLVPAAGLADDHRGPAPDRTLRPPAPVAPRFDDRRDLAQMRLLLARYEALIRHPGRVRARLAVEAEILRALDAEVAESRRELRWVRGGEVRQARAELARLQAIRAEFAHLYGRPGRRATERKHGLLLEATRLARRELRRDGRGEAWAHRWR